MDNNGQGIIYGTYIILHSIIVSFYNSIITIFNNNSRAYIGNWEGTYILSMELI